MGLWMPKWTPTFKKGWIMTYDYADGKSMGKSMNHAPPTGGARLVDLPIDLPCA